MAKISRKTLVTRVNAPIPTEIYKDLADGYKKLAGQDRRVGLSGTQTRLDFH